KVVFFGIVAGLLGLLGRRVQQRPQIIFQAASLHEAAVDGFAERTQFGLHLADRVRPHTGLLAGHFIDGLRSRFPRYFPTLTQVIDVLLLGGSDDLGSLWAHAHVIVVVGILQHIGLKDRVGRIVSRHLVSPFARRSCISLPGSPDRIGFL